MFRILTMKYLGLPLDAGYIPLTAVSLSMFADDREASVGTATFTFSLTAR